MKDFATVKGKVRGKRKENVGERDHKKQREVIAFSHCLHRGKGMGTYIQEGVWDSTEAQMGVCTQKG